MNKETLLEKLHEFNSNTPKFGGTHFVGAILDSDSDETATEVALVLGINFGQIGTSSVHVGIANPLTRLRYAAKVKSVLEHHNLFRLQPHVVLWNFYPYLTAKEWKVQFPTMIDEAEVIFTSGWKDPIVACSDLIALIRPQVVIVHGAHSAVALLAKLGLRSFKGQVLAGNNMGRPINFDSFRRIS